MTEQSILALSTPCLLIERSKMRANIARLAAHIEGLGCVLRPHVKTHKSLEITQEVAQRSPMSGITVSTIAEAKYFFDAGYTDILYAVGIVPNKLSDISELMQKGCDIKVILDSQQAAQMLTEDGERRGCQYKVLIELDVDGHRAGVLPSDDTLMLIARTLHQGKGSQLMGVMTHAGGSYNCTDAHSQLEMARQERDLSLLAAKRLKDAGLPCPMVSIGSTPTAFAVDDLAGITEVRAGVYVLFDLVMAGLGVCSNDDIAISVLSSIIGFQHDKNIALCDAGWMAMSRDRGTQGQAVDQGYGLVQNALSQAKHDLVMTSANQEHGIIGRRAAKEAFPFIDYKVGDLIRILPNHACSTAAQFPHYYLVDKDEVIATLSPVRGW